MWECIRDMHKREPFYHRKPVKMTVVVQNKGEVDGQR
jgi:hypothetical protein